MHQAACAKRTRVFQGGTDMREMLICCLPALRPSQKSRSHRPDRRPIYSYTLKDFDARPVDANAALVDYMADYGGKFAGELLQQKAHTARFGRDKATNGNSCTFRKQKWSEALDRGGDLTFDKR
jgi:hypothetical protein